MAEWSIATDCKSVALPGYPGSNPGLSTTSNMVVTFDVTLMNKSNLQLMLTQEPLLMREISHAFIDWKSLLDARHPSLFFGVGLCTSREPAVAVPFDILTFFFLAEKLRRQLELDTVFILIADTHARTNTFMTEEIIRKLSTQMKSTFTKLIRNLQLRHFQIIVSSDIHQNQQFQTILKAVPSLPNEYLRQEIADLMWFTMTQNVRLKLGWSINNDPIPEGHDERFFDTQIRDLHALPLSFLHSKAGRTFDPNRPKASPYISIGNEPRILLSPDERVKEKITAAERSDAIEAVRGVKTHLGFIVRLFESLFVRIPKESLDEKVQFIIDLSTHG
jgi:hypothetical protein